MYSRLSDELLMTLDKRYLNWRYFEFLKLSDNDCKQIYPKFYPGCLVAPLLFGAEHPEFEIKRFGLIISVNTKNEQALVLWQR